MCLCSWSGFGEAGYRGDGLPSGGRGGRLCLIASYSRVYPEQVIYGSLAGRALPSVSVGAQMLGVLWSQALSVRHWSRHSPSASCLGVTHLALKSPSELSVFLHCKISASAL